MSTISAPNGGRWMSVPEFAAFWGVHVRTVYRWIDEGRLPDNIIERAHATAHYRIYERRKEPRTGLNLDIP
jgi:predicted site-specific integrase-resolvase